MIKFVDSNGTIYYVPMHTIVTIHSRGIEFKIGEGKTIHLSLSGMANDAFNFRSISDEFAENDIEKKLITEYTNQINTIRKKIKLE